MEQLLEVVKTKGQFPYPSRDFACKSSADVYAFWIALKTGKQPDIEIRDPDQYATLRERVAHIMGVEQ
jgi:hypothetical protein